MVLAAAAQLKAKGFFASEAQQARFVWLRRDGEAPSAAFDAEAARLGLGGAVLQIDWPDRAAACLAAALVVAPAGESALCVEAQALGAPLAVLHQASGAKGSGATRQRSRRFARRRRSSLRCARAGWIPPGPPASLGPRGGGGRAARRHGARKSRPSRPRPCPQLFRRAHERPDARDLRPAFRRERINLPGPA